MSNGHEPNCPTHLHSLEDVGAVLEARGHGIDGQRCVGLNLWCIPSQDGVIAHDQHVVRLRLHTINVGRVQKSWRVRTSPKISDSASGRAFSSVAKLTTSFEAYVSAMTVSESEVTSKGPGVNSRRAQRAMHLELEVGFR